MRAAIHRLCTRLCTTSVDNGSRGRVPVGGYAVPMTSSLSHLIASTEHTGDTSRELAMSPLAFGILAMVAFLVLLAVLWAFRGTAAKIAAGNPHSDRDYPFQGDPQAGHH
jgi:hypothetical protein